MMLAWKLICIVLMHFLNTLHGYPSQKASIGGGGLEPNYQMWGDMQAGLEGPSGKVYHQYMLVLSVFSLLYDISSSRFTKWWRYAMNSGQAQCLSWKRAVWLRSLIISEKMVPFYSYDP
jgi:hypothetical protein